MQNLSLAGAGTASTVLLNDISGSGNNMVITMTGLEGGVSAFNIFNNSGNITVDAGTMTGAFDITSLDTSGAGAITISSGTLGNFSAGTVNAASSL